MFNSFKFKIVLICIISLPVNAAGDWKKYGTRKNGDKLYYKLIDQQVSTEYRSVMVLADFIEKRSDDTSSGRALITLDCKKKSYRYVKFVYFRGAMGTGVKERELVAEKGQWISPKGNTHYTILFDRIC